ncbi:MAG: hypothetical protein AAGK09_07325, partial [Planctomycetota bacterium]
RGSLKKAMYQPCPACNGTGHIKTPESVVLDAIRKLQIVMLGEKVARLDLTVSPDVAFQLLNRRRDQLVALERRFGKPVMVRVGGRVDEVKISAFDTRGGTVNADALLGRSAIPKTTDESFLDVKVAELPDAEADAAEDTDEVESIKASLAEASELDIDDEIEDIKPTGMPGGRSKRKRRRRGRGREDGEGEATTDAAATDAGDKPEVKVKEETDESDETADGKKKRRRRRRRRKSSVAAEAAGEDAAAGDAEVEVDVDELPAEPDTAEDVEEDEEEPLLPPSPEWDDIARREYEAKLKAREAKKKSKKKSTRSRSPKKADDTDADSPKAQTDGDGAPEEAPLEAATDTSPVESPEQAEEGEGEDGKPKRKRRRRRRSRSGKAEGDGEAGSTDAAPREPEVVVVSSYGNARLGTKTEPVSGEDA